ncbi:MAG: helix-turn-helix domain-containing protein [Oscillochloridaceae bacterium umkhey_bin13]
MSITLAPTTNTPLSLVLFTTAMARNQSISQFASDLKIGTLSLRQFMLGNTQRPRQKTLDAIAEALGVSSDEVRAMNAVLPYAQPAFGTWLAAQIDSRPKYTRARLVRETDISDSAVRNYLNGKTLPDAHQAARIATALEVDPEALAAIIVATMIVEEGRTLEQAPPAATPAEPELEHTITVPLQDGPANAVPVAASAEPVVTPSVPSMATPALNHDEAQLIALWRQLHPQARRATYSYIAMLLAER